MGTFAAKHVLKNFCMCQDRSPFKFNGKINQLPLLPKQLLFWGDTKGGSAELLPSQS